MSVRRRWFGLDRALALTGALLVLLVSCGGGNGRSGVEQAGQQAEPQTAPQQEEGSGVDSESLVEAVTGAVVRAIDRDVSGGLRPIGTIESEALITATPAQWGDTLVVGTAAGELVATGVSRRQELWRARFDGAVDTVAATRTALFAAAGSSLYRLSPVTGEVEWSVPLEGWRAATPLTSTRSAVYLGLLDGTVIAFNPEDGAERWRVPVGATPVGRMVLTDGRLYIATEPGDLIAVRGDDGSVQWRHGFDGPVAAGPADLGGRVAAATIGGEVSVLSLDGETYASWRVDAAPILAPPVGSADRLVIFDGAGSILAFEPDGTPSWKRTLAAHLAGDPGRVGDVVFAGEASGGMVAIGMRGGDVVSRIALGAPPSGEAILFEDELAWALTDGSVRRVNVDGEVEQVPLFSAEGTWVLPENGTFRLADERVALTMRSERDAVFEISVSAAPSEDLVLRVVSQDGATVATNMGKVELARNVRAALDAGDSYELVIERPDADGEVMVSVQTRQLR